MADSKLAYFKVAEIIWHSLKCEIGNAFYFVNCFTILLKSQNKRLSSKRAKERQGAYLSHDTFALFTIKTNIETCCIPARRGQGSESCNW